MQEPISYRHLFQVLEVGLRSGALPGFAYSLGCHVLDFMAANNVRQAMLALPSISEVTLTDSHSRIIAGDLGSLVHEGVGFSPSALTASRVSLHYIAALQKLHWSGLMRSDILESRLNDRQFMDAGAHFTMLPDTRDGVHWTEETPMVYRIPELDTEQVVARFVEFQNSRHSVKKLARFL